MPGEPGRQYSVELASIPGSSFLSKDQGYPESLYNVFLQTNCGSQSIRSRSASLCQWLYYDCCRCQVSEISSGILDVASSTRFKGYQLVGHLRMCITISAAATSGQNLQHTSTRLLCFWNSIAVYCEYTEKSQLSDPKVPRTWKWFLTFPGHLCAKAT